MAGQVFLGSPSRGMRKPCDAEVCGELQIAYRDRRS